MPFLGVPEAAASAGARSGLDGLLACRRWLGRWLNHPRAIWREDVSEHPVEVLPASVQGIRVGGSAPHRGQNAPARRSRSRYSAVSGVRNRCAPSSIPRNSGAPSHRFLLGQWFSQGGDGRQPVQHLPLRAARKLGGNLLCEYVDPDQGEQAQRGDEGRRSNRALAEELRGGGDDPHGKGRRDEEASLTCRAPDAEEFRPRQGERHRGRHLCDIESDHEPGGPCDPAIDRTRMRLSPQRRLSMVPTGRTRVRHASRPGSR